MERVFISTFVNELEAALQRGDGYIMGARGQNPRTGYLDLNETKVRDSWKVNGWYYSQYAQSPYGARQHAQALSWRKSCARVWDCNGMAEGIYEIHTGVNIDSKARYNYAQWCDPKGKGTIPAAYRAPGAAVFWSGGGYAADIHHVAYLYKPVDPARPEGDWYIIEARGVMYGVVMTRLYERKPDYWGWMTKYFDYDSEGETFVPAELHLGDRLLKNGSEGEDVREMQTNLIRLGYDCGKWGADGEFGDATEMAVRRFQAQHDLKTDGEFGPKSLAAMEAALAALEAPAENPHYVAIEGGDCYVRDAPGKKDGVPVGAIRGVAHEGAKLPWASAATEDGWLKVTYKNADGWVSGKYGRLVEQ